MLTYQELIEKKLSQLNQQHVGSVKGLEKAMHSQGIDPGESKRDAHHVNYPNARFRKSGKPATGITAVDNGKGGLTSSTGGVTVRDAVIKSGRVDKRPAAKAKRAKEASENKERKAKQRDPFTREHTEWWIDAFRLDEATEADVRAMGGSQSQIDALKKRQEKRGYGFQSNDQRNSSAPNKTQSTVKPTVTRPSQPNTMTNRGSVKTATPGTGAPRRTPSSGGSVKTATPGTGMPSSRSSTAPKPQPTNSSALAKREPGGRGVGTTQSSYKTGALSKRPTDALVKGKNFKTANNDEKKTGSRPGSTRDGWGVKPTGDFKDPGNAAHDGAKRMSDYDKARKQRDINNKLDKEDKNKNRLGRYAKSAASAAGKALMKPGKSGEDVETGSESGNVSGGSEFLSRTKRG